MSCHTGDEAWSCVSCLRAEVERLTERLKELEANDGPLVEQLAALAHEQWSGWMLHLWGHDCPEAQARWLRQVDTPYADLSEDEKESDRKEARRVLAVFKAALAGKGE